MNLEITITKTVLVSVNYQRCRVQTLNYEKFKHYTTGDPKIFWVGVCG